MNAKQTMEAAISPMVCVSTLREAITVHVNRDTACKRIANFSVKVRPGTQQLPYILASIQYHWDLPCISIQNYCSGTTSFKTATNEANLSVPSREVDALLLEM